MDTKDNIRKPGISATSSKKSDIPCLLCSEKLEGIFFGLYFNPDLCTGFGIRGKRYDG